MQPNIANIDDYREHFCMYYLRLEEDLLRTEPYLTIAEENYSTFSTEFIKQYQTICSEIDVVMQWFCKKTNPEFRGQKMNKYCSHIVQYCPKFENTKVRVLRGRDNYLMPWQGLSQHIAEDGTQKDRIVPDWWNIYNKVKHGRTLICTQTGKPYFQSANLKNVLTALAALYIIETCNICLINNKCFTHNGGKDRDCYANTDLQSKIFEIEGQPHYQYFMVRE